MILYMLRGIEEKYYICLHCGKTFSLKMDVNKDTTIHINAKPHQCKFCDKTFIKYGNLIRHV